LGLRSLLLAQAQVQQALWKDQGLFVIVAGMHRG